MKKRTFKISALVALLCCCWSLFGAGSAQSKIDFARDIQPILQTNCVACHGPSKSQAQLRLDEKTSALTMIQPGNAKASRLLQRVLGEGSEPRMPQGREALKPEQIELLRRWINEGASWPDTSHAALKTPQSNHWAFIAPTRPALPAVKNAAWVKSPIDRFILATLEQKGLAPASEADKATLIRRLSLDLIGLPPALKEIDDFLADASPNAYEKLVDRLLASPHYGERWGRWWLDAARYADTNGYEKDHERPVWPYRDWVINSFNQDKPFDQFTIEQIGGDLLPNATIDQKVATGFLRNSMRNEEAAVEPEQFRVEELIDRVDAVGKAFLGLTVNCAQCHTHKFDPIKHEEYYQFYAFLNQDEDPELEVPTPAETNQRATILARIAKLENELRARHADMPQRMAAWEAQAQQTQLAAGAWTVLENAEGFGTNGVKYEKLLDDSFIPRGDSPPSVTYYLSAPTSLKNITGIRLELLTDHSMPRTGPGRSKQGVAWLSEFSVEAAPAGQPEKLQPLKIAAATADFALATNPIALAFDGNVKTSWSTDAGPRLRNQDRRAVFTLQTPIAGFAQGTLLRFALSQKEYEEGRTQHLEAPNIGRFRLSVTTQPNPQADQLPTNVRRILAIPAAQRTAEQQREMFSYYRTTVAEFAGTNKAIIALQKDWPYPATTLVLTPRQVARETHIFNRGDWKRPGDAVTPDTPSFLHPFPTDAPRNRLGLGQWLAAKNNPLTARVIVNRVWQQYFGQGLVISPEDLGTRCDLPSHPALLDWLAVEFRDGENERQRDGKTAWRLKHIHKLIVMSATYRQSSKQEAQSVDATNRWLARAPRLRVDAEAIRDIALSASGLLSLKIGGPSVFPPIPEGAMAVSFRSRTVWETSQGEDRYRRGMYTFWKRNVPFPSMSVFDAPNGDVSCTRRIRSNSPLQALTTLNDTAFMEAAQALALRVWKEGGADDVAKVRYGFRLSTSRWPDAKEEARLLQLLQKERERFVGNTAAAVYVSSPDLNNLPADIDLHQLAAWTLVARVMLNLDETITKQ